MVAVSYEKGLESESKDIHEKTHSERHGLGGMRMREWLSVWDPKLEVNR